MDPSNKIIWTPFLDYLAVNFPDAMLCEIKSKTQPLTDLVKTQMLCSYLDPKNPGEDEMKTGCVYYAWSPEKRCFIFMVPQSFINSENLDNYTYIPEYTFALIPEELIGSIKKVDNPGNLIGAIQFEISQDHLPEDHRFRAAEWLIFDAVDIFDQYAEPYLPEDIGINLVGTWDGDEKLFNPTEVLIKDGSGIFFGSLHIDPFMLKPKSYQIPVNKLDEYGIGLFGGSVKFFRVS